MGITDWFKKKDALKDVIDPEYGDLLTEAKERFLAASEADNDQRELELDDLQFCKSGGQWPEDIRAQRDAEGRPCLEVDRLNTFVRNVCNEMRQMRPQPQVNPTGDGATKETAEILQGMIRHIVYQSSGDAAVDTASESMVRCGRGYLRVLTEYQDAESFNQDIVIKRIPNPHMVYFDPAASEPDGSDAEWAFIVVDMPREAYKREYPSSKMAEMSFSEWKGIGDAAPEWAERNGAGCRIAEYYKRVRKPVKLVRLSDGSVLKKDELPEDLPEGITVVDDREAFEERVLWYKLNAVEVLDKTEWAGKHIPIIPVYGTELIVDGKRTWSGLVRAAKDPQRHYNYLKSAEAEAIALAPKAPIIAPKGALGTGENRAAWKNINKKAVSVAEYEAYDSQNRQLPSPQRLSTEVNIAGITQALMGSVDDLKATTGMFDPSLGNREGGQSGVAIRQLQRQGQVGNFHFTDNVARSVRHLGRILIDLIPKIYDAQQLVRIVKPDETTDLVMVNGPSGQVDPKTGYERIYDLSVGKYDVTVSVGPSYQTRRQEIQAQIDSWMQGPMGQLLTQVAPDLMATLLDTPISKELVERLKKAVPPQFQDSEKQAQIPPQVMQQMQQAEQLINMGHQHIQQLEAALQQMQQKLDAKDADNQVKLQIAAMQEETKRQIALLNSGDQHAQFELQQRLAVLEQMADRHHDMTMLAMQPVPEPAPAEGAGEGEPGSTENAGGVPPGGQAA